MGIVGSWGDWPNWANMLAPREWAWVFAFFLGAVHIASPDHWFPFSILAWQKKWRLTRTLSAGFGLLLLHVLGGAAAFFILLPILKFSAQMVDAKFPFLMSIAATLGWMTYRFARFSKTAGAFSRAKQGRSYKELLYVLGILGPAETLIPVLVQVKKVGGGYLIPMAAYALGTFIAGLSAMVLGRYVWNRPTVLPRGLLWLEQRQAALPAMVMMAGMIAVLGVSL